ncbi:MFS transporter [Nocardia shimofusensis]|uniref:MFS transporter n=1 Tax=Nocardia shimofusensis TaxID=228596 RepID=UPI000836BD2F
MLFKGSRECVPLYALYALLFADHGLNTAQISSLLALWSVTSFVLEVPSGAWADTVSRRGLLVLSGGLVAGAFTLWTVTPSYLGFALGFVLWGVSGALESGTFEALMYDELAARARTGAYARLMGYARAAAETTVMVAILAAAPLYALGGYALVGWVSVSMAVVHTAICLLLPNAPKAVAAPEEGTADVVPVGHAPAYAVGRPAAAAELDLGAESTVTRYLAMLRAGVAETWRVRGVRRGVLLGALLFGITAYDEYFALLAQSAGVSTTVVPVLIGVTVAGSMTGTLLAGRTSSFSARALAWMVAAGGVLFVGGALVAGAAVGRPEWMYPLTVAGFVAIGIGYGAVLNAEIVADARLQDAIEGPARATVTSVSGLLAEVVALGVFGVAALAGAWLSMSATLAILGSAMFVIAALTPVWLPRRRAEQVAR